MWQQSWDEEKGKKNVADGEKCQQFDSGHIDSGFLSGTNITSTEDLDDNSRLAFDSAAPPALEPSVAPEPMRADSGVDIGLSEDLSHLTLKPVTLNPLSGAKVQSEPTLELTPVTTHIPQQQQQQHLEQVRQTHSLNVHQRIQQQRCQDWTLYYMQDDDGDTHLHNAIGQGFIEVAFSLITMAPHPCLLDISNDERLTPLHLAVATNQARIVRRLVLAGANPALRDANGNTPLHLACASGHLPSARALIEPPSSYEKRFFTPGRTAPALPQDLEQRNYEGQTCLHTAVINGRVEMMRLLLRNGADLEAGEWLAGRTALHLSIERQMTSVTAFLLKECAPRLNALTYAGITAYQIAACRDNVLARELVRLGAEPQPTSESDSDEDTEDSDMSEDDGNDNDNDNDNDDEGSTNDGPNYHVNVSQIWQSVGLKV